MKSDIAFVCAVVLVIAAGALGVWCVWLDRPASSPCPTKERHEWYAYWYGNGEVFSCCMRCGIQGPLHTEGAYATIQREELAATVSNLAVRVEALERKPQVQFVPPIQPPQFTVTTNLMTGPNAWGIINNTGLLAYTNGVSINGVGWLTP